MPAKLQVGVVGLGVGEAHARAAFEHSNAELAMICDFSTDTLKRFSAIWPGVKTTADVNELLADTSIDVVVIASYDDAHAKQIVSALNQGKSVFAEKPICLSFDEAYQIAAALRSHPEAHFGANMILRRSPRFLWIKDQVSKGTLGQLFHLEGDYLYGRLWKITDGWRGQIPKYSVTCGGGVHLVDLMLWLSGKRVTQVTALASAFCLEEHQQQFPDHVVSLLEFADGSSAKLSSNFGCVLPHVHQFNVFGTKATFLSGHWGAAFSNSREEPPAAIDAPYPGVEKAELFSSFIDTVRGVRGAELERREIFDAMMVCFAVDESVRRRASVEVKYLEDI